MKKLFILLGMFSLTLTAAPVENPSMPKLIEEGFFIPATSPISIRTGYEGDFVGDAMLNQYGDSSGRVDDYSQVSNCGIFTINLFKKVDVFTVLGTSRTSADWRFTVDDMTSRAEVETLYDFIWGMGGRGILYSSGAACLGIGARYEASHYENLWMTVNGDIKRSSGSYLHWQSWQIDLDFSYKIDLFTPYIGVKYSNVRTVIAELPFAISDSGSGMNRFKNRTPVGVVIGCSLCSGKCFMMNIEGRLIDEEAVTISGDLKF
jgi:hypothetical protein